MSNVYLPFVSVYQRMSDFVHTLAYASAICNSVTGILPLLKINNTLIEKVSSFNYLGVTLNELLTWNTHIDKISSKISKYNGLLNKLKHYLASNVLKTLYESLILPHINYALLAWGFNSTRIYQLQKKAIRILTKSKYQ